MSGRRVAAAVAGAVAVVLGGSGVGVAEAEPHGHVVVLSHGRFEPAEVEVAVGETVVWENHDADPQSVTADDGSFDSHPRCTEASPAQCMRPDETFSQTFSRAGSFPYYSRTEGGPGGKGMSGTVRVVGAHGHG